MASTQGVPPGQVLQHLYARCLASESLPQAIEHIAEYAGRPTLFHCAAGKDRTGMVAAVVLSLLDVNEDAIVADCLRSATAMPRMVERFMTRLATASTWRRCRSRYTPSRRRRSADLLATLRDEFGGARVWASRHGIGASTVLALDRHLVHPT